MPIEYDSKDDNLEGYDLEARTSYENKQVRT